jgi:outer membrane lipoprotein carrier protein
MLKHIFFLLFVAIVSQPSAIAQAKETSDPNATKLLEKLRKKYEAYTAVDLDFNLVIELPGAKKEIQKGKISQSKESFRLTMDQQTIISDGKTNWIYLKKNNEVQILDANPKDESGFLTPKQLLQQYQNGKYIYAITDKVTEGGVVLTQIEFKPVDKKSEYSKIRLSINEKTNQFTSIIAFAKDGSRYTFVVVKQRNNTKHEPAHYTFDKAQFPGARIEDLRM